MVEKTKLKKTEGKKQVTVSQMQKTNQILVEKLNSKNENAYEVVKTNDDIVEMKRKQYTQIEDGTTKVSVISEQFLNITSRKRQLDKGDTDRIYKRRTLQAKKMEQLVEHVAEGDEESKVGVVDQQDPKFVEVVAKKSKALKENKMFTPAQVVTTLCIMQTFLKVSLSCKRESS